MDSTWFYTLVKKVDLSLLESESAMYIPLFLIAGICICAYLYFSWKISRAAIRSIAENRPVQLAGSKRAYIFATIGLSSVGTLFFYLGLVSLANAPIQPFCVVTVLIATLVMGVSSAYGLKYVRFTDDSI